MEIFFLPSFFSCHCYSFGYISEVLTFLKDTTVILRFSLHFIVLYFIFHGLHFATTFTVLKPVLCFNMTLLNYSSKMERDLDSTCRCHQSNIMPDSIFSVNIAQCITCG